MPVLAGKLFAPARRARLVERRRLLDLLDQAPAEGHRLTLVSAPAGFGKTTLLGAWLAHAAERADLRVAWVSLDAGDDDPARLLLHVSAALEGAGLAAGPGDHRPAAPRAVIGALLNRLADAGGRWVLVLDDYHVIGNAEVHEAVTFLLDHQPAGLHLVLATRADPPLPLARLRARGQLTEVRAADLRFTAEEAGAFLNDTMGLGLGAAEVGALDERTEGWIAGLQLAGLSLRGVSGPAAVTGFITAFTGSNRFVIDYLADEVLARLPPDDREFLLRTSLLDRLTGDLCDAVTGRAGGSETLAGLDRAGLFLVPLDDTRGWYRYHHLFADVLRARLAAERPEEVAGLHRRASAWHADAGLTEDAIRHALAGEDFARAGRLIEEAVAPTRRRRDDRLLLSWIRALPGATVRRSPVLCMVSGWSRLMAGDLGAAEADLDRAEALLAGAGPEPPPEWADTEDLRTARATIPVYRASLAQARGDVAGTVREATLALGLAGPGDHVVLGGANGFLGLAAWAAGDVERGLETFSAAARSLHAAGNLVDELDTTIPLADMWVAAGRPGHARRRYEQALAVATARGAPVARAAADLHTGLAELDRELDDLEAAAAHLETARVLGEQGSITENRYRWFVAAALLHAARGEHDAAAGALDRAEALHRPGFYPDVRPIPAVRARLRILAGDPAAAAGWAAGLGDEPGYLHEYEHLTLARLLLARGSTGPALELLGRLRAAAAGRAGSLVEISALTALAQHLAGEGERAAATLGRSLAEAPEPGGRVRLYLDEGEPMSALLRLVAAGDGDPAGHARRLLGAPRAALPEALSPRELEVLRLLGTELTGPQLAARLHVSINTLRSHTKRIFTKLDVTTRNAAVRRAREVGLL